MAVAANMSCERTRSGARTKPKSNTRRSTVDPIDSNCPSMVAKRAKVCRTGGAAANQPNP